ncbi:flavin-containing monooxygenase [Pseudonocardia alni]|uniref:Cyclohexanone monooxygenase n=1 Tax=Pseudonocardia alni TaxID=33907 RepID=A0A852W7R1_PSEA5|nr:NAD(P)/FAD-dependent oxidoreductase [Pseudonocardia antarctica]NYG01492.1 cyclohexanone monooxygenase [Pseudonocardia antarctica]
MRSPSPAPSREPEYDAVVVGAGFAGLHMLHRLRTAGLRTRLFEAGDAVGGTWFWNRYPGARCDFESVDYSYGFDAELQRDWTWSERYPSQPEILRYLDHVADRFGLRADIRLSTRVCAAHYDGDARGWTVRTAATGPAGRTEEVTTRLLIMATGALSAPRLPDVPGIDTFAGRTLQTSLWPREGVDLRGERVAVVGTGSSGAQVVPRIAEQAERLHVLQRTPVYVVPAHNRPLTPAEQSAVKEDYPAYRDRSREAFLGVHFDPAGESAAAADPDERRAAYEERWRAGGASILACYPDLLVDAAANETLADFLRGKIAELVVDPETARRLTPRDLAVGSKRLVVETDYYPTFNRPSVELVDLREEPLAEVTPRGVRVGDREIELDVLVFATGFDALTGPLLAVDVSGVDGVSLADAWADGPSTYLGLAVAGFPNLFTVAGPGSPSVLSNVVRCTEENVEWIGDLAEHMRAHGATEVHASAEAAKDWTAHVGEVAETTLLTSANSWYVGANVPGKPRVFMPYAGGLPEYHRRCAEVAERGYEGFSFR